jgi:dsDNA-binding SOS-regulon protein
MLEEIHLAYEEILQLEQALIELDEQNTTNTLEIRKREAKVIFMLKQAEEIEEVLQRKENNSDNYAEQIREQFDSIQKQITQHRNQIEILNESTKQNLLKRHDMRQQLYEYYSQIRQIRDSIQTDRITMQDNKDFLALVIKNNYLESQNVQLLLNLQLQARTIIDLKNMIHKQQLFIEENDIGMSPQAQAGSKLHSRNAL